MHMLRPDRTATRPASSTGAGLAVIQPKGGPSSKGCFTASPAPLLLGGHVDV